MSYCQLNPGEQRCLQHVTARSIAAAASGEPAIHERLDLPRYSARLQEHWATFVTLRRHGELRGCRGTVVAEEPLIVNVARSARSAACTDERFVPVSPLELDRIDFHISILHPPEPVPFESERDLLARLRPGRDGLILRLGLHQGLFLPAVWQSVPDPASFLERLKQKAGLPPRFWSEDLQAARFTVDEVHARVTDCLVDGDLPHPLEA